MRGWVAKFKGEYIETEDNVLIDEQIAVEVPLMPSDEAKEEKKIQKEMYKILRKMAIDALKPTPTP